VFSGVDRHRRHVSGKLAVDFSEDLRGQEPRPAPETAVLRRTWLSMAAIRATSDT